MPTEKPIPPDFPDLPERLQKICGGEEYRRWRQEMEEWRVGGALSTEKFISQFPVVAAGVLPILPKLVAVVSPISSIGGESDPYLVKLDGATEPTIVTRGKLLSREVARNPVTGEIIKGNEGQRYILFSPPPDFMPEVIRNAKGVFPINRYGLIRTNYEIRYLPDPDGDGSQSESIKQVWYQGYTPRNATNNQSDLRTPKYIYIFRTEFGWNLRKVGTYGGIAVYGEPDVFDMNVGGSTWQMSWVEERMAQSSFPVTNVVPTP